MTIKEQILMQLRVAGEPVAPRQLARLVGADAPTVRQMLSELEASHDVVISVVPIWVASL